MRRRMVTAGLALLVGCVTPIVIGNVHQGAAVQARRQADARSADQLQLARELPSTPPDVVAAFVDLLAEGGPFAAQESCLMFNRTAAAEFAQAQHAPSCIVAMQALRGSITDPASYANDLTVPAATWTQLGNTASVNGCAVTWSGLFTDTPTSPPGPLPGVWTLAQLDGEGWQITQYQPC